MTPEEKARIHIDENLTQAGWALQNMQEFNPAAGPGVAVREYPTDSGPADYILFIDKKPVGVIEAKREEEGVRLTIVEDQSSRYASSQLKWTVEKTNLRFVYESTGIITRFTDHNDNKPRSRVVFSFHKPETLKEWLAQDNTLRNNLTKFPELDPTNLRDCQVNAITRLEKSFGDNKPRALIQMATGSGKTYTAITFIYRLLKYANAKRVLFLVDTRNLGEQAEQEFMAYTPNDDPRKFTELYNVQRLSSRHVATDSQVCISTIQRMYSMLRGEDLQEGVEEESPYEHYITGDPRDVAYNEKIPLEFFDFIVIDECHRSIYNLWRQVLEYFDGFLIGLTATPDSRTFAFFNENVVSEYTHEQAVADGVNVGYDLYTIETEITKKGSKIKAKEFIDKRDKLTRRKRWTQLDEDVEYTDKDLDKSVVNISQIRNIIKTFKEKMVTEIFPGREEVPKTLIFAKSDSHADDIINIVREEFGEGNDFCKKVTYKADEDPKSILASFRNDYYPRIAVTVDMIATGTDVKPLECLLFMRDVKSSNYFEQMKGRGTRTLGKDDLRKVTPTATENKTHFVIVDAVGVSKSVKTASRPLERKPTVKLKDLMLNIAMNNRDEDTLTSLANRLTRLDRAISESEQDQFKETTGGKSLTRVVKELLHSYDQDTIDENARKKFDLKEKAEPSEEQLKEVQKEMIGEACEVFYKPEVRKFVENVQKTHEQIIDTVNLDTVTTAEWDKQTDEQAKKTIQTFKQFIEENKDEIAALKIYYSQPHRFKEITYKMVRELYEKLKQPPYMISIDRLWLAYHHEHPDRVKDRSTRGMLTDIVSLLRYELKIDTELRPYSGIVDKNFQDWVFKKNAGNIQFNKDQMEWLRMIKEHIAGSMAIDRESFDYAPFDSQGGIGKMYKLFGDGYENIIDELNEALAA